MSTAAAARAFAKETWNRQFFQDLKKSDFFYLFLQCFTYLHTLDLLINKQREIFANKAIKLQKGNLNCLNFFICLFEKFQNHVFQILLTWNRQKIF